MCAADLSAPAPPRPRAGGGQGGQGARLEVDTTNEAANDAMVARCAETLGGVDVLVAAAGVASPRTAGAASASRTGLLGIPTEQFRAVIDVNLYGVLFSNRAVARWMVANMRARQHRQPRLDHVEDAVGRAAPTASARPACGCSPRVSPRSWPRTGSG